jgi:hypothetical protein
MNSELKTFFEEERKRVVEPGPYFAQRVMARLASEKAPAGIWDFVPRVTRPVLALALVVLFVALTVQILVPAGPAEPMRGSIEVYMGQDLSPRERMLFIDPLAPSAGAPLFDEFILLEPVQ